MKSPIIGLINHMSNVALLSTISGGVGYLFARVVKQISPIDLKAAVICGAVAGGIGGIVWVDDAKLPSYIVAVLGIAFLPFYICEKKKIQISFKASVCVSSVSLLTLFLANLAWERFDVKKDPEPPLYN